MTGAVLAYLVWTGRSRTLDMQDVKHQGFHEVTCLFRELCRTGAKGVACRRLRGGQIRSAELRVNTCWGGRSNAGSILKPMREAVVRRLEAFEGPSKIFSLQYAGYMDSGQFHLGQRADTESGN